MENQFNKLSGKVYQGQNQADLQVARVKNSYQSNEWLTFLQAKELKLKIKKGSKGVSVFKGFGEFSKEKENGKVVSEKRPLRFAKVFNLDVCEKVN